jgi:hypothetical protein
MIVWWMLTNLRRCQIGKDAFLKQYCSCSVLDLVNTVWYFFSFFSNSSFIVLSDEDLDISDKGYDVNEASDSDRGMY